MTKTGKKIMGFDRRLVNRIQARGTRGDIIKSLAELIKNADDAYDRLELTGKKTNGIIEIGFWKLKKQRGYSITGFFVRDFGSGMSTDEAKTAFYGEQNYGSDTSGETRNGALGVGGKDCFYGMLDSTILSIKDNSVTVVEISTTVNGLESEVKDGEDALVVLEAVNKMISKCAEPITLSKNQTFAMFRLPENSSGARADTLTEHLRKYYTLRWILESDMRTVKLIDVSFCNTSILRHEPIESELIFEKSLMIPYKGTGYEVTIQFMKSEDELDHRKELGYGLLIQTGRGAILDNTMFNFGNDSAAARIFGKVIINDWKKLYRIDSTVLTDNREGLDYQNPFNKVLQQHILTHLNPIINAEREKQGKNPKLNQHLDNNIKKAFSFINKIILKDPDAGMHVQPILDVPPEGIQFSKDSFTVTQDKPKKIMLFLNPGSVPTNSEISLQLSGSDVIISPENFITSPISYDDTKVPFVEISITGKKIHTRTTLKAWFGDLKAETEIYVVPERDLNPKNGFAFRPTKTTIIPKKTRRIGLIIDTNLITPGTAIEITCDDDRVEFSPKKLTVTYPPNLGKYLSEEIISITCNKLGLKAKLTAETKTNANEERTTICEFEVKEKEPPKQFFKDYKLDREGDKRVRSRFRLDEGIIYVHVNSSILRYTFGPKQEHLENDEIDAVSLLADTIVQRMAIALATFRVDSGKIELINDKPTEIEREKNDIEFKHGLQLYQTIISGAAKHEDT